MKCQVCSTTKPERFGASVLICDHCLVAKQMKAMQHEINTEVDKVIILGLDGLKKPTEPKGILSYDTLFGKSIDWSTAQTTPKGAHSTDPPFTLEQLKEYVEQFKQTTPPTEVNCKCVAPQITDDDSIARTRDIRERQLVLFGQMMQHPIRIHVGWIRRACDEHFNNTTPLLDNATFPLPL